VRIRALSVFEGVVYHCYAVDTHHPCRPVLEVEARTQPGDLDAGPLLLTVADYMRMAGPPARDCLHELHRRGRIVSHQDVDHLAFATWTPVEPEDAPS
jgi:hypothetical protein